MKKQLTKANQKKLINLQKRTKQKAKKQWALYTSLKNQLGKDEALKIVRSNIKNVYTIYRNEKYPLTHKSKFEGLKLEKKDTFKNSKAEFYEVKTKKNIKSTLNKIFKIPTVKYVLITFKIQTNEGLIQYVSDSFTKEAYERVFKNDLDIFKIVMEKLSFVQKYDGYELLSTHIRLIYENLKAFTKTKRKKVKRNKK